MSFLKNYFKSKSFNYKKPYNLFDTRAKFFKPFIFIPIMVEKKCKDCGKEFEVLQYSRYPRKYCKKCSKARKKAYENVHLITADECEG